MPSESPASWLGPWPRRVLALVIAVFAAKALYLALGCPYTLVEDEAHYWEWSRRLDWSYYSKGPGVAWAIALANRACSVLGLQDTEFAVRLASLIASAVFTLAVAGLAAQRAGATRARDAWLAALLTLLIPVYFATGFLMTIDMPMLAMWALAAWAGWHALARPSQGPRAAHWSWPILGLELAVGFLFKYTMLLIIPGLILGARAARRTDPSIAAPTTPAPTNTPWKLAGLFLALLGLIPVILWNSQRGWPTLLHLMGHMGLQGGDVPLAPPTASPRGPWLHPEWTLTLLATQIAMLGPAIAIMFFAAREAWRGLSPAQSSPPTTDRALARYCSLVGLPVFALYLLLSPFIEPEGNWPIASYVTLIPLAAWRIVDHAALNQRPLTWRLTILLALLLIPLSLRVDGLARIPVLGRPWNWNNQERRPLLPLGRITGAATMAHDAARIYDELAARPDASSATQPVLISQQYGRASILAFYLHQLRRDDIPILCASSLTGGRRTQYDLWPESDPRQPTWLARDAVIVGGERWHWEPLFEQLLDHEPLQGEVKRSRKTYLGLRFRGAPSDPSPPANLSESPR